VVETSAEIGFADQVGGGCEIGRGSVTVVRAGRQRVFVDQGCIAGLASARAASDGTRALAFTPTRWRSPSNEAKKNVRSLRMGPPTVPPKKLLRAGVLETPLALLKKLLASRSLLRRNS
jgi:hypothetical protein